MKKTLTFFLALTATFSTFAQGLKIGIQLTPTVSYNRVNALLDDFTASKDGTGMRFTAGPVIDWFLLDNVAISTGLWFSNRRAGINVTETVTEDNVSKNPEYTLHYMQLPISVKMFVNEIAGVWRPYIQVGTTLDLKVSEKLGNQIAEQFKLAKDQGFAKFYDLGLFIALGTEMRIFNSNSLFAAITYQRGLLNVMKKSYQEEITDYVANASDDNTSKLEENDEFKYKNDAVGLMLGFKF